MIVTVGFHYPLAVQCIYCKQHETDASFRKPEHVIPQSFGLFKRNLTLRGKVCDACNQALGDELDIHLARDTLQGFERFQTGIKAPAEYKHLGSRATLSFRVKEGLFKNSYAYFEYSPARKVLALRPLEQVGFRRRMDNEYDFFLLDSLSSGAKIDLSKYDLSHPKGVVILSEDVPAAVRALKGAGVNFPLGKELRSDRQIYNDVLLEVTTTIDAVVQRAVAKIGFEYLAYWNDSVALLSHAFDVVRAFIRDGTPTPFPLVAIDSEQILADEPQNGQTRLGHIVVVDWNAHHDAILARLSLFNDMTFKVILTYGVTDLPVVVGKGSFWNIADMRVLDVSVARQEKRGEA